MFIFRKRKRNVPYTRNQIVRAGASLKGAVDRFLMPFRVSSWTPSKALGFNFFNCGLAHQVSRCELPVLGELK